MKLAALAATKIEGDIIEAFVRHTLQFVDRLAIVDNASLDGTREVLDRLVGEGLALTIWDGEAVTPDPARRTENARKALAAFGCDYLLLLDVDEFVIAPSRQALEAQLASLPEGAHALVAERTYVPTPEDDPNESNPVARIRHRLAREPQTYLKIFLSKAFLAEPDATIVPGNHAVEDPRGRSRSLEVPGLALGHFPVRGIAQLRNKGVLGWPRFLAMGFDSTSGLARHWKAYNDEVESGVEWDTQTFFRIANDYLDGGATAALVLDPLPVPVCRYRSAERTALGTAVAFTRQIAVAYAALGAENRRLRMAVERGLAERYLDLLADTLGGAGGSRRDVLASLRALCERAIAVGTTADVFIAGSGCGETAAMARAVFAANAQSERRVWLAESIEPAGELEAIATLRRLRFADERSIPVPGTFDRTLAACPVERIALLVLDLREREAAFLALESLYTRVERGGFVLVANAPASSPSRAAVDAFRAQHAIANHLATIGPEGLYWQV